MAFTSIGDKAISVGEQSELEASDVLIDGASTDGTLEYLQQDEIVDRLISEKDSGIYDAWNKACKFITGEWILFLGAGDAILEDDFNSFYDLLAAVDYRENAIVYGNVHLVDYQGDIKFIYKKIKAVRAYCLVV